MPLPGPIVAALEAGDTVVTPSPQRAVAVREAWARRQIAAGRRVWTTPDVLPFDAWVERGLDAAGSDGQPVPRALSPVEQQLAWRAAARAVVDGEPTALLGASRLADALRRADELVRSHEIPERRIAGEPGSEARWLQSARNMLRERLQGLDARIGWQGQRTAWGSLGSPPRPVWLAGFDTLLPAQRSLVGATIGRDGGEPRLDVQADRQTHPRVVATADPHDELRQIAQWCGEHLQCNADARLLIVLPDLDGRVDLLERALLDELDPAALAEASAGSDRFAIEGGRPLARVPRVALALERLGQLVEAREREDWLRWLRGPEIGSAPEQAHVRLEQWLRAWQGDPLTLAELLQHAQLLGAAAERLPAGLLRIRGALLTLETGAATSAQWATRFDRALRLLDPDPGALDSTGWQTHERWQRLLEDFAAAQRIAGPLTAAGALRQLRGLAQRTRFAPAAAAAPVLATAATADPIVRYDGIWVGGLHQAAFPRGARSEPFLPWALQRQYGVVEADPDALLARAHYELAAWRRCTDSLTLSFARQDNGADQVPSPLLRPWMTGTDAAAARWVQRGAAGFLRQTAGHAPPLEARAAPQGLPLAAGSRLNGGASALTSFNQCAFRGYAEFRLGARRDDAAICGIDVRERGSLYHVALQRLWRQLGTNATLAKLDDAARRAALTAAVASAAAERATPGANPVATRAVERESRRAVQLIDALLAQEARRPAFRARLLEEPLPLQLGPVRLDLRIDRVDELAGGDLAIIDYKTGRGVPSDWNNERSDTIQLLAYRAALLQDGDSRVVALCYAQLSESQVRYRGVAAQPESLAPALPKPRGSRGAPDWTERLAGWERQLEWLGRRIAAGDATVEPRPSVCRTCNLALLCRRAEMVDLAEDDDPTVTDEWPDAAQPDSADGEGE